MKRQGKSQGSRTLSTLKQRKKKRKWRVQCTRKKIYKTRKARIQKVITRQRKIRRRRRCAREKRRRRQFFEGLNRRSRRGKSSNSDEQSTFEGDIMLTKDQMNRVINSIPGCPNQQRARRSTKNLPEYKWPGGLVAYELTSEITEGEKVTIRNALAQLQTKLDSCIRFQEASSGDRVLVKRSSNSGSSWSYVGYSVHEFTSGVQELALGWFDNSVIYHEFLHAIGLEHTQTRSDRDSYIKIMWDNIHS